MDSVEQVLDTIDAFESCNVSYMVVGAFSSNVYGIPRSTRDADFVVELGEVSIGAIASVLGDDYVLDRQIRVEGFTGSLRNDITYRPTGFRIEVFRLGKDEHHQIRFKRRTELYSPDLKRPIWIPTAEDVVIQKLRWARPKDCEDICEVLAVQAGKLDDEYLRHWTARHGTTELLETLLTRISDNL
jgi:hypothetical protein